MPLIEVNQIRHISASIRLDEITATVRCSLRRSLHPGQSPRPMCER